MIQQTEADLLFLSASNDSLMANKSATLLWFEMGYSSLGFGRGEGVLVPYQVYKLLGSSLVVEREGGPEPEQ
jgi:hypothetical protein